MRHSSWHWPPEPHIKPTSLEPRVFPQLYLKELPACKIHTLQSYTCNRTDSLKEEGSGLPAHGVMSSVSTPARFYLLGSCFWDFLTYYLVNLSVSSHSHWVPQVQSLLFYQGPLSCLTRNNSSTEDNILPQGSRACDVLPLEPAMSLAHLLLHWYL